MQAIYEVFIGLGSNLNDPIQQLYTAYNFLKTISTKSHCQLSSIYKSLPLGPQDQPCFYNAVCRLHTSLSPHELLLQLKAQEKYQKRLKTRHWGERTIDLDILIYNRRTIYDKNLIIPHPGISQRLFVLQPLAELAPDIEIAENLTVRKSLQIKLASADWSTIPEKVNSNIVNDHQFIESAL